MCKILSNNTIFIKFLFLVKPPSPPPAPELPKSQPPTWQQKPWQQRTEPPAKKPWQQKEAQPSWAAVTEQITQGEVTPLRADKGFVTTRSERILESNLEYRRSQEPEERPVTATAVRILLPSVQVSYSYYYCCLSSCGN